MSALARLFHALLSFFYSLALAIYRTWTSFRVRWTYADVVDTASTIAFRDARFAKTPHHVAFVVHPDQPLTSSDILAPALQAAECGSHYLSLYDPSDRLLDAYPDFLQQCATQGAAWLHDHKHTHSFTHIHVRRTGETSAIQFGTDGVANEVADADQPPNNHTLYILMLGSTDGRHVLADVAAHVQSDAAQVDEQLIDAQLPWRLAPNWPEPDLALLYGPAMTMAGLLPWTIRVTEFQHMPSSPAHTTRRQLVYAIHCYAGTVQRYGK